MNIRNAIFGALLAAAPGQASIMQLARDPGLTNVQNFSAPSPSIASNFTPVTTQFQTPGVPLTFSGGVVYDPNQQAGGNCTSVGLFAPDANCVTNYTLDGAGNYSSITTTSFTFTINAPAQKVAFFLFQDELPGTTPMTSIYANGILQGTFGQTFTTPWYLVDLGGTLINSITLTGVNGANTTISPGGGFAYGLVLSHVETTPEPGTLMLFATGLGAVAFFARRRKA